MDKMTRMAAGPDIMDAEDWVPSKIYLNVPLMWNILQFNFTDDSLESPTAGLLDPSLSTSIADERMMESSMLEIIVATSPEITINTADGGQEAPTLSFKAAGPVTRDSPWNSYREEDSLTFNFTPWLYADFSQMSHLGDVGYAESSTGENRSTAWWEGDNFGNMMFNNF